MIVTRLNNILCKAIAGTAFVAYTVVVGLFAGRFEVLAGIELWCSQVITFVIEHVIIYTISSFSDDIFHFVNIFSGALETHNT